MDAKTLARFWRKVDKNGPVPAHRPELGPCWVWTGKIQWAGYGMFSGRRGVPERKAHRLSWELAHGTHELCVLHKCDNPACVNVEHLFLGTQQDNVADMRAKGRGCNPPVHIGAANFRTRMTAEQVIQIRELYAAGTSQPELGKRFGMSQAKISDIVLCRVWKHLPGAAPQVRLVSERANVKLTESAVLEMRALHRKGVPTRVIAKRFGMCVNAARNAITRVTWAHVA